MSKIISILGATGNQGGAVATHFLALGWNVRGISRNSTSASAKALIAKGIPVIEADVDKPEALLPAFRGAHVIFVVTDFWGPFFARFDELKKISNRATGCRDGILKEKDKGKLWGRSSLLSTGFYMTNMIEYGPTVGAAKTLEEGRYILRAPCSPKALHPLFDTRDTGLFVELLVRAPPQQELLGVSEKASFETFMRVWTEVTGVPSGTREINIEEADRDAPGGIGKEAAEATAVNAEFGWE